MTSSPAPSCAVVTGAASGIGRGLACALATRGIDLVLADIDADGLRQTSTQIAQSAPSVRVLEVATNLADAAQIEVLCERAFDTFGRADWLYNCAGTLYSGPSWELDDTKWARVLDINLWSAVRTARAFVPRMLAQGSGHIVNIASLAGLLVGPWLAGAAFDTFGTYDVPILVAAALSFLAAFCVIPLGREKADIVHRGQ